MDELERLTGDFDPDPDRALAGTMRRVNRRRATRRASSAVLSLAMFSAAFALAWSQFRPPTSGPIAGPTGTPRLLPSPGHSTYCVREDSETPWCITKVSETVPLAAGTLGTDPWTLYGYRAVFDGFRYVGPPDALALERVRHPSVCLDWEGLERDMGFCETGVGLGFDAPRILLQAPPAKRAAPPEVMRWEVPLKDGYGPSVGYETSRGYLIVKWTLPSTERITVDFDGKSMEVRVIGPFPKLRTDWKLAIVDLPRRGPAVFRAYDADGDLIWEQHMRAERLD